MHLDESSFAAHLCMVHVSCCPPQAREERRSSLRSIASLADVDDEPLFCFETALKTCYWCVMVYTLSSEMCACSQLASSVAKTAAITVACYMQLAVSDTATFSDMHMSPAEYCCQTLRRSILVYRYQEVQSASLSRCLVASCLRA